MNGGPAVLAALQAGRDAEVRETGADGGVAQRGPDLGDGDVACAIVDVAPEAARPARSVGAEGSQPGVSPGRGRGGHDGSFRVAFSLVLVAASRQAGGEAVQIRRR